MIRFVPPFRGRYIASISGGVTENIARVGVAIGVTCAATVVHDVSASASVSVNAEAKGHYTYFAIADVTISATAVGQRTVSGTGNIGVDITSTADGSVFTAHSGVATVGVTIEATAASAVGTTHSSSTAGCQVNISASANGYNISDTIPDETTNGNNMVMEGTGWTFETDAAVGTRSVDFGNSNDTYGIIDESYLSVFRSPWSFSCWYKPDDGTIQTTGGGTSILYLLHTGINGTSGGSHYLMYHYNRKLRWHSRIDTTGASTLRDTGNVFSEGTGNDWVHIVVTVDNVGNPTMYLDGSETTLTTDSSPGTTNISNYSNTSDVRIGLGKTGYADGYKIDDVSIWSTELTSTQVTNLYNSGSGTDLTGSSNLAGWWKMGDSNVVLVTHSGTATVSVDVTASADGTASTTHLGTASCQVNLSASASGTHIQSDESIVNGLSGKLCWFDANDITGSSNGDALSSWPSRHDSGVSASNSTSSTQPIYNTNQVNSLPAVNFDADYLEVNYGSNTAQPLTAFIVCAYDVTSGGGSNNALDGRDNPSGYRAVNFSMRTNGWGSYAGSAWMQPTSGSPDTDWHYFTVYLNGASSYVRKDGASHATGNPGSQGTNGQILGMWKGKNTSYYMNGKIAEVLIFDGTLSDTNRNTTESYLKDKYNL